MTEELEFDRAAARDGLTEARQRIEDGQAALAADPSAAEAHRLAQGLFDDALEAAALARGLDEPEREVRAFLAVAADAAVELFRRRGALTGRVTSVPSQEDETFVDTSLTNPWTYVRALYAALAAGQDKALDALAALPTEDYRSDQVEVAPVLERYVEALQRAAAGADDVGDDVDGILAEWGKSRRAADRFWVAQAKVLDAVLDRDEDAFGTALKKLADVLERYFGNAKHRDDIELLLELPVLGLQALGRKVGLAAAP